MYITKQQDGKFIKPMAVPAETFEARKGFYSRDGWVVAPQSLVERYFDLAPVVEPQPKKKANKEEEKQP